MRYKSGSTPLGFGNNRKIGVEIEACNVVTKGKYYGKKQEEINKLIRNATTDAEIEKIIFESKPGLYQGESATLITNKKWRMVPATEEGLVAHGGAEITSNPFIDSEESWQNLFCMCDNIKKYPGTAPYANGKVVAGNKCGLHVHFDATELANDPHEMQTFLKLYCESEELLYKMCNPVGEPLRSHAMKAKKYQTLRLGTVSSIWKHGMARPSSKYLMKKIEQGTLRVSGKQKGFLGSTMCKFKLHEIARYRGLNLTNIGYSLKNTIEFRMANGCLNPEEIKKTIFLYASLYDTAVKIADGKDDGLIKKWESFQNRELTEEEKVNGFLELIMENPEDRKMFMDRWQSVKDEEIYKDYRFLKTFKREDYKPFVQTVTADKITEAMAILKGFAHKDRKKGLLGAEKNE